MCINESFRFGTPLRQGLNTTLQSCVQSAGRGPTPGQTLFKYPSGALDQEMIQIFVRAYKRVSVFLRPDACFIANMLT